MKAAVYILLLAFGCIESRKTYVPVNKNAITDFINIEGGGGARPGPINPSIPAPTIPPAVIIPTPVVPAPIVPVPNSPVQPKPLLTTTKPVQVLPTQPTPTFTPYHSVPVNPARPAQPLPTASLPNQMILKPVPVRPTSAGSITTPGNGNVQQLVNFYDSQAKGGVIKPYSYSQAARQG